MNIIIKESGAAKDLSIIDPATGVDYTRDFIGNTFALNDGQFVNDDEQNAWLCSQDTYDWWAPVVEANHQLGYRIANLKAEHGSEAVAAVVESIDGSDLEDLAAITNAALDEVFGAEPVKMYMHTVSGDVASEQDWKDDFDAMDRESWFGVEIDECKDLHWLNDQPKLVEVVERDGEWVQV